MPRINADTPDTVKPYLAHGLTLSRNTSHQWVGDCPFCGRDGKFCVEPEEGLWRCLVCSAGSAKGGGNVITFLRLLWDQSSPAGGDYAALSESRRVGEPELESWGVRKHPLTGEWVVPGYSPEGKLTQLYRYAAVGDRKALLATSTLPHGVHGVFPLRDSKTLYVCEGPWDGMALREALAVSKKTPGGYAGTGSADASLLNDADVIAVPGCTTFPESWARLCSGKDVVLMYDSDHPRKHPKTGRPVEPAGLTGMKRAAAVLARAESPPSSVSYLHWGDDGYDPSLKDGWDVRDSLMSSLRKYVAVGELLGKIRIVPAEWIPGHEPGKGTPEIKPKKCDRWHDLRAAWRKAMKWTDGLDRALAVMLSSCMSVQLVGDQLWVKIISPPSGGKTSLCEGLAVARDFVTAKSVIRGFHSGFQTDRGGEEDHSLLNQLRDKTLVTKDGDTLLQSPNLSQILAEARDVYDRNSNTSYRNKASREYSGVNMTWILCGTSSLRVLDSSELGERFLDCVIMEGVDPDLERDINLRKLSKLREMMTEAPMVNGKGADDVATAEAKALTGGYVCWLRANGPSLVKDVVMPDKAMETYNDLGTFVAYMRARPSSKQDEEAGRELSTRLTSQLGKLGYCLAVVLNRGSHDDEVLRRVRLVALDTARGRTLEIVKWLYKAGEKGADTLAVSRWTGHPEDKQRPLLKFLRHIGVLEIHHSGWVGLSSKPKWRLTDRVRLLYDRVVGEES